MKITNLCVAKSGNPIINQLNADFSPGIIHTIMGPNGSGKTTLSYTIAGHPDCQVSDGSITWQGLDMLAMPIHQRSIAGIFLAPQYPSVIEGLSHAMLLKEALNVRRFHQGLEALDEFEFLKLLRLSAQEFNFDPKDYIRHSLNKGFSGGEKKRNEILQISLLQPKLVILDEIDSGLDVEAMQKIAQFITAYIKPDTTIIAITHYPQFARMLQTSRVHVIKHGSIRAVAGPEVIEHIEKNGFGEF